ncbi:hypothetical protein C0993_010650 [Termitomyces sp. T159_Od127]|nr:hypothetical protein C0993_010650 [Termitomyces sp. T159_Od127]
MRMSYDPNEPGPLCQASSPRLQGQPPYDRFGPRTLLGGGFIQSTLPIPKVTNRVEHNMHEATSMQRMFEQSQELRAEAFQKGAKDRDYMFTINEAKREAEFVKVQQKRQETFDEAEELRESGFEEAQRQYEAEFQVNEIKREDDFRKNEAERMDETRRAQEHREQVFQSIMTSLQQRCIDDIGRRLKEVENLGEELMMRREPGLKIMDIGWYK